MKVLDLGRHKVWEKLYNNNKKIGCFINSDSCNFLDDQPSQEDITESYDK